MTSDKRTEYLRGIAASAPEVRMPDGAKHNILSAVFDEVRDRNDWRAPINALVTVHEYDPIGLGVYLQAIEHFTATKPEVFIHETNEGRTRTTFRIVSEGYRLGPAGA